MTRSIPLVDLAVRGRHLDEALAAMSGVLERGWFILGPEVQAFEAELASSMGCDHAVGVSSGTDALILGLQAVGLQPGDEVVIPAMTAFPTAAAVLQAGGVPVLVDVEPTRPILRLDETLDAVTERTRAVILVHLYGVVADAPAFATELAQRGIALVEDCAQAQGGTLPDGRPVGSAGAFAAMSFYPTKNLGALGDGGALVTSDDGLAAEVRAWRSHGERGTRYVHSLPARNSRLDDLQAAVLRPRLRSLAQSIERRRAVSERYAAELPADARYVAHGPGGAPHLAVIRSQHRSALSAALTDAGIGTGVHYPMPLQDQPALAAVPRHGALHHAAEWAAQCLSIPLHDHLSDDDVSFVIDNVATLGEPWW